MNNEAYTNAAAATALRDAVAAAQILGITPPSIWTTVADGVTQTIPFNSNLNIYEEYDGYNGEQIKQADVVMLTYPLGFPLAAGVGLNDLNYYAPRTDLQGVSTNGSNWRVVATAAATSTGTGQFTFTPTQAQYVRLDFPGGTGASAPDIDELSVSGP